MSIGPTGVLAASVLGLLAFVACAAAQQPAKLPLIAILSDKTAKAIGLTIPPVLLARADEVIE
jgi:hypothetical protein